MPRGKSPPRPRKEKGSDKVWVSLAVAALTAAATVTAAVSGGGHAATVAPQPPTCVVIQGSVKVP
jgi:hypothetical protein